MTYTCETSTFTILLLEPDNDTRPLLKENLTNEGYRVLVTLDAADAVDRASYAPSIHLILINQVAQSVEESIAVGRLIRQDSQLPSDIPLVVLAEEYSITLEGQNIQENEHDYVTYLEDGQQLLDLLEALLKR